MILFLFVWKKKKKKVLRFFIYLEMKNKVDLIKKSSLCVCDEATTTIELECWDYSWDREPDRPRC